MVGDNSSFDVALLEHIKHPSFFHHPEGIHPRVFSQELDKQLGFKVSQIENKLLKKYRAYDKPIDEKDRKKHYAGTQTWIGLHPQILQTPYSEILKFLEQFHDHPPKRIVDLGAGYGRVGIVMNSLYPDAEFLGYEVLEVRQQEANRIYAQLELNNCKILNENILEGEFTLPDADIYFIYDFSDPHDLKYILKKLVDKFMTDDFFIVAKGDGIRSLIQNKFPELWALNGVVHEKNWSLYSSFVELQSE